MSHETNRRIARRDELAKTGSMFATVCGTDCLPCGICDDCVENGVLGEDFQTSWDEVGPERMMTYILDAIAFHRNGICGMPFYAVTFTDKENGEMMAVVFDEDRTDNPRVAVFNREMLADGNIEFGQNSWRGDHYADWLYAEIDRYKEKS